MVFKIHHDLSRDFFRSYHTDVLDRPEYAGGDVTKMEASLFDRVARNAWGLKFEHYSFSNWCYYFIVADEDRLNEIGMASYGELLDD